MSLDFSSENQRIRARLVPAFVEFPLERPHHHRRVGMDRLVRPGGLIEGIDRRIAERNRMLARLMN